MTQKPKWTPGPYHRDGAHIGSAAYIVATLSRHANRAEWEATGNLLAEAPAMAAVLRRFVEARHPHTTWSKVRTQRSLAWLEAEACAILARLEG